MTQRYLSVHEAAIHIGVTETSMRQRVKRGSIPFIRDGKSIRFDIVDLDKYMAARKVKTNKEKKKDGD